MSPITIRIQKVKSLIIVLSCFAFIVSCQSTQTQVSAPTPDIEQSAVDQLLFDQIDDDIEAFRLSSPANNNALAKLADIEKSFPEDQRIPQYRDKIAKRYLFLSDAAISRQKLHKAKLYIDQAKQIDSSLEQIEPLEEKLEAAISEADKLKAEKLKATKAIPLPQEEITPTKDTALAVFQNVDTQTRRSITLKEHIVVLDQKQIAARSTLVGLSLDNAGQEIVDKDATVVIFTQSMRDYRWLSALLKTSVYLINSDFQLKAEPHVEDTAEPKLVIKPRGLK